MMKKTLFILLISLSSVQFGSARQCRLEDLSRKFTFLAAADRSNVGPATVPVSIEVIRKADRKRVQMLSLRSGVADIFSECEAVRSYATGKHANEDVADNYWGDLIVADVNFDGREDLAVAEDSRNTGTTYGFYIQSSAGTFIRDRYLSDGFFPYKIDRKNKTLTTSTAASTGGYTETVLKYDPRTKKWRVVRSVHRKVG
jgi:hypothetical protein